MNKQFQAILKKYPHTKSLHTKYSLRQQNSVLCIYLARYIWQHAVQELSLHLHNYLQQFEEVINTQIQCSVKNENIFEGSSINVSAYS